MTPDPVPRILFVPAFLSAHGGLENQVLAYARTAREHGYGVSVLTPRPAPYGSEIGPLLEAVCDLDNAERRWRRTLWGRIETAGAYLKAVATDRHMPAAARRATLAQNRARPFLDSFWVENGHDLLAATTLLHAFGKPKPFVVEALRAAADEGVPTVYTEITQVTDAYAHRADFRGFDKASNRCDQIVVMSEGQGNRVREHFSYQGDITVIEQWADGIEDELLAIERHDRTDEARVVVGSLCRLTTEKGLDTLLRGLAIAGDTAPGLRLHLAGTGELEQTLRSLADELNISSQLEFMRVFGEERVGFYRDVDVFAVCSPEEGGPITGVEAMAAGLPLVSTSCGAMPDRVRPGVEGLRFEPGDADGLASALLEMVAEPQRRAAMGRAARRRYLERCHSQVNQERLCALWEGMARQRVGNRS